MHRRIVSWAFCQKDGVFYRAEACGFPPEGYLLAKPWTAPLPSAAYTAV
jgi:hypothetical protein